MRLTALLPAVTAALVLAACEPVPPGGAGAGPSSQDPLGGSWRILSIGGVKTADPAATQMTFTGIQTVTGTFGCNQFTGNYTYEGYLVYITNISTTRMACSGPAARQEERGLRLLAMPMQVVPGATTAILSGREGQSFALAREGVTELPLGALPTRR